MKDPLIGQQLGPYRIENLLGQGGMARVYYGWDENLQRPVAVKVLNTRFQDNPAYAERFVQEARAVATWRHDNVLQVYAAGQEDDLYYFAMEYVDGPDLAQLMNQYAEEGELIPHEDVVHIGRSIADALDYAHQQGVIHRDVKPSNVMIAKDGRVALADFGLALDVHQGSMGETFGTARYIAPEQAQNSAQAVSQSDIYALGVILYEMLTGAVPFNDPSPTSTAVQHMTQPPPPPRQVNPKLNQVTEEVLLKALRKTPEERYQTGAALLDALGEGLAAEEEEAGVAPLPPPPPGVERPNRALSQVSFMDRASLFESPLSASSPASSGFRASSTGSGGSSPPAQGAPGATADDDTITLSLPWLLLGAVGLIAVVILGFLVFGGENGAAEENPVAVASSATPTLVSAGTDPTAEAAPPTDIPATTEPTAVPASPTVETVAPTETAAPITSPTSEPTDAPPAATATAVPPTATAVPPSPTGPPDPTEAPAATIAYPQGNRMQLFYDEHSFYLHNPNHDRVRISDINFEALNGGGQPAGYYFNGGLWAQFYSFIESNGCDRIEINRSPAYLRPGQCRAYNATVTPSSDDEMIFWIERPGVTQFRVLWGEEEIARCDAGAAICEVYLP